MLRDHGYRVVTDEGRAPGHHLVQHAAERVEIARRRRLAAHRLLRRHVARRAHHHPGHRQARTIQCYRQPEVADLRHARSVEPDVSRFQITVHDAARVRVLEAGADLLGDTHHLLDRQPVIFSPLQHRRQIAAGHVLRDDVRVPLVVAGVEHGHDVRVIAEPPHRLRLALHARASVGVEALRLDHGKRHVAVEPRVVRQVDLLAPALAEEALYHVASTGECGRERRDRRRGTLGCARWRSRREARTALDAECAVGNIPRTARRARDIDDQRRSTAAAELRALGVIAVTGRTLHRPLRQIDLPRLLV